MVGWDILLLGLLSTSTKYPSQRIHLLSKTGLFDLLQTSHIDKVYWRLQLGSDIKHLRKSRYTSFQN